MIVLQSSMLNRMTECHGSDLCITLSLSFGGEYSTCGFVVEVGDDCPKCDTISRISLYVCVSLLFATCYSYGQKLEKERGLR